MSGITRNAYAKLNLALGITGLAGNGYHLLDSAMQTIDLCDEVTVEQASEVILLCDDAPCASEENLAYKAARLLRAHARVDAGARITLVKRIPAQAGLGGGSADAAATLLALNGLWRTGLGMNELQTLGLQLGADVPFALHGGTARARGVGGDLLAMDAPNLHFALARPSQGLNTAQVYREYDTLGAPAAQPDMDAFCRALALGDVPAMAQCGANALQEPAVRMLPAIGALLDDMRRAGALYAAMTGSGSAVFGIFATRKDACAALPGLGPAAAWRACASAVKLRGDPSLRSG